MRSIELLIQLLDLLEGVQQQKPRFSHLWKKRNYFSPWTNKRKLEFTEVRPGRNQAEELVSPSTKTEGGI